MTEPLPDVLRWGSYAKQSGARWGIPPAVLLGLVQEETGGREGLTSSAGAKGLTQFTAPTARSYHVDVRPGHAQSQIEGAARYLHDLGYGSDPKKALASYNAGPGNWHAGVGYAEQVLKLAGLYGKTPATAPPATGDSSPAAQTNGGGLFSEAQGSQALYALLFLALAVGGLALLGTGVNGALGGAPARAARKGAGAAKFAAVAA